MMKGHETIRSTGDNLARAMAFAKQLSEVTAFKIDDGYKGIEDEIAKLVADGNEYGAVIRLYEANGQLRRAMDSYLRRAAQRYFDPTAREAGILRIPAHTEFRQRFNSAFEQFVTACAEEVGTAKFHNRINAASVLSNTITQVVKDYAAHQAREAELRARANDGKKRGSKETQQLARFKQGSSSTNVTQLKPAPKPVSKYGTMQDVEYLRQALAKIGA